MAQSEQAQAGSEASDRRGFPIDMILVPGGKVTMGTGAKELLDYTKDRFPRSPEKRVELLDKLAAELGAQTVMVEPFYLHKYPVTNEQYLQFIQSDKTKHRFPFHWWKFGKPQEYESKREAWRKAFPNEEKQDLLYWERYWRELPYAIPPGQEKYPVVLVSWIDAQAFAGWAGARLPTEAEWLYAATGGSEKRYLWGDDWTEDKLKELRLYNARDKALKPVGELGGIARGPFGHDDMVGNVWEWMGDIGFFPFVEDKFRKELDQVKRHPATEKVDLPDWRGDRRTLKGGSFFSGSWPEELRVQTRAPLERTQVVEGVGFRIAKSQVPARDMCRSRLVVEYDSSFFGAARAPNNEDQIGVERYDLSPDGKLILDYHAIAVVPVNHLGLERNLAFDRLRKAAQETPVILGTLITTEKLASPALEPGIYTIYWRYKGMPKELEDAIRDGHRALAAARQTEKSGGGEAKEKEEGKAEPEEWRQVLARYGITEDEVADKDAQSKIDFVRLKPGLLKVPVGSSQLIFRANTDGQAGDFALAMPAGEIDTKAYRGAELSLGASRDHKEKLEFTLGAPWSEKGGKTLVYKIEVELTSAADVARPWHTPQNAKLEAPRTGAAAGVVRMPSRSVGEHRPK